MSRSGCVVTDIVALDKKRCKVFLDEEFAFVLYRGELDDLGVVAGERLAQANYEKIRNEILPKRAKLRAMNLLKSRDYTEKQLHDKLQQGLYPLHVIDDAISYVKSFHYMDDERYAREFVRCHCNDRPAKRLEADLLKRGISAEIIGRTLQELCESPDAVDECGMIREILLKKKFDLDDVSWQEKQKMCAALMRKGFDFESIRNVLLLDI